LKLECITDSPQTFVFPFLGGINVCVLSAQWWPRYKKQVSGNNSSFNANQTLIKEFRKNFETKRRVTGDRVK